MGKRTGSVYEALDVLAEAVRPIRARKNLVLFSPGIVDIGETVRAGMIVSRSRYLDPALRSLNAANVSVYSVQLQRPTDMGVGTTPLFHQRLTELASETGGEYFQSGASFMPIVKRVEKTNAGYYLVTYRSQKSNHAASTRIFLVSGVIMVSHPPITPARPSAFFSSATTTSSVSSTRSIRRVSSAARPPARGGRR